MPALLRVAKPLAQVHEIELKPNGSEEHGVDKELIPHVLLSRLGPQPLPGLGQLKDDLPRPPPLITAGVPIGVHEPHF